MDDSLSTEGRIIWEEKGTTTWKRQKHNLLTENDQETLIVPHRKAFHEDTACASRVNMKVTFVELERTLYISLKIIENHYLEDIGAVNISSGM